MANYVYPDDTAEREYRAAYQRETQQHDDTQQRLNDLGDTVFVNVDGDWYQANVNARKVINWQGFDMVPAVDVTMIAEGNPHLIVPVRDDIVRIDDGTWRPDVIATGHIEDGTWRPTITPIHDDRPLVDGRTDINPMWYIDPLHVDPFNYGPWLAKNPYGGGHLKTKQLNKTWTRRQMAKYNYDQVLTKRDLKHQQARQRKDDLLAYWQGEHSGRNTHPLDANGTELFPNTRVLIHGRPATVWAGVPVQVQNEGPIQTGYIQFSYDDDPDTDVYLHGTDIQQYTTVMTEAQQQHLTPNHEPDIEPTIPIDHTTEEEMRNVIENGNFPQNESTMPEVVEKWALGHYPGQKTTVVPDWMIPDVDDPTYNAEYRDLMLRYRDDPEMSRNLERVREAADRNQIVTYMNNEHNEIHSIWTDPKAPRPDHARVERITQETTPFLAYTATGHPVLVNDPGIDHQAQTYMNMVNTPTGVARQLNFDRMPTLHQGHLQILTEGQTQTREPTGTTITTTNPQPDVPLQALTVPDINA